MSTHNIGFYEEMMKIIFQLSSNIFKIYTLSVLLGRGICSSGKGICSSGKGDLFFWEGGSVLLGRGICGKGDLFFWEGGSVLLGRRICSSGKGDLFF